MFIPDPGSQNSNKREGWKKLCCHYVPSHQFHKIENYFSFEMLKKKIWANFQRIIELLTQKIVTKLSKIWVWDPGYEIRDRDPEKPTRSRGQKGTGSRIRIRSNEFSNVNFFIIQLFQMHSSNTPFYCSSNHCSIHKSKSTYKSKEGRVIQR